MSLTFDHATHTYRDGPRVLPSVTQILREAGLYSSYSFAEAHHKFRGHAVHAGAAIIDMGGEPRLGPVPKHLEKVAEDILAYWGAFVRFKERTKFQGRIWECSLVDPVRNYAGTFDALGEMGDDIALLDVKSGVLPELVPVQLALYAMLMRNGKPINPKHPGIDWMYEVIKSGRPIKRAALRVSKDGKDTMFLSTSKNESYDLPRWEAIANSVLNLHAVRSQYKLQEASCQP